MTKISSHRYSSAAATLFHNILCFNFIWNLTQSTDLDRYFSELIIKDSLQLMTEPAFLGNIFFLISCADNSLPEMIFSSGISADTTQSQLNENEQKAHTKLRWEHTQNSISNQSKAQAGHSATLTPHCSQSPGKAPETSTRNSSLQTNATINKQSEFMGYSHSPWKK